MTAQSASDQPKKTACILCAINCGLEIQTGGKDGRELLKIKGDKEHPSSQGYLCNKAARLNHYQSAADRLTTPMRRKADGTYEPVDWDTAIREVAAKLKAIRDEHGGDKIYSIGGGGQGNHLGGMYATGLMNALGVKYKTNALAQEKTGEFWVGAKMFGGGAPHGDFHHAEVGVFVGKNPWQTHGFPQTRKVLREIANDPARTMIVLDPALSDTAKMADMHLRLKPGTDAWCLSAMVATIVQEGLVDEAFVAEHTDGFDAVRPHFETLDINAFSEICDIDEELIRKTARRIATASSTAVFEDLGTQQNVHSTLVSYLQRIMWVITGHFAKKGAHNCALPLMAIAGSNKSKPKDPNAKTYKTSPVLGRRVITGLLPCNEVPDEILTDHPDRFRAAIIQSSNPVHSYADTPRMREAMRALEFSVVIDIAMTETAKHADYVLPASSQFEKHECTFFAVEFPRNYFHLRHPIVDPLPGTLPESEIHSRLIEEIGGYSQEDVKLLKAGLENGRQAFAFAFMGLVAQNPDLIGVAPSLLYRTLGPTLDDGKLAEAAPFWALCHQFVQKNPEEAANAGFAGDPFTAGEAMFERLITAKSGFEYTVSNDYSASWKRVGYPDKKIRLHITELFPQVQELDASPLQHSEEFPFIMSAGNRRATTANTIVRDHTWDRKGVAASLQISPNDAAKLNLADGDTVRVTTKTGSGTTYVEINEIQRDGTIALPNGLGLEYTTHNGDEVRVGIPPNELTASEDKDFFAATPWHKYVPARIEKVA